MAQITQIEDFFAPLCLCGKTFFLPLHLNNPSNQADMAADAKKVVNGKEEMAWEFFRDNNPIRRPGTEAPGVKIAPHWYTTAQAETSLEEAKKPFEIGIAMHEYQDSYSHWQKLGKPDDPGEIWEGHIKNWSENERIDTYNPSQETDFGKIDATMTQGMNSYISDFVIYYFVSISK